MRISSIFFAALLAGGVAYAGDAKKPAPAPAKKAPPPKPKKQTAVSADNKKKLAEKMGGFKFGMTKDEVIGVISKQLDQKYDEKIKSTQDITQQDRYRKDRKEELATVTQSFVSFDGKKTGWDVSIIEDEFAHHTEESMIERWENSNGKNERRFFFFFGNKLWKMFISLDVSMLPADKKNFDEFRKVMVGQYGDADADPGMLTWHTDEFDARAVDKLKTYDALGFVLEDNKAKKDVEAIREAKKPPKQETNAVINAVVDKDGKDHPDVKSNGNAVDDVINANGGSTPKKK
jgi:hypothetical protein